MFSRKVLHLFLFDHIGIIFIKRVIRLNQSFKSSPVLLVRKLMIIGECRWIILHWIRRPSRTNFQFQSSMNTPWGIMWCFYLFEDGFEIRVSLDKGAREKYSKIAFRSHHCHYEFLVMSFRLRNARQPHFRVLWMRYSSSIWENLSLLSLMTF